jgi:hypothetical protein
MMPTKGVAHSTQLRQEKPIAMAKWPLLGEIRSHEDNPLTLSRTFNL